MPRNKVTPPRWCSFAGLRIAGDVGPLTFYHDKRGRLVAFLKTIPKATPSPRQTSWRLAFALAARSWNLVSNETRDAYRHVARRSVRALPPNCLYVAFRLKPDPAALATVARQANVPLDRLE